MNLAEINASELAHLLTEGNTDINIVEGLPEGSDVIDAWFFEGVIYLRLEDDGTD